MVFPLADVETVTGFIDEHIVAHDVCGEKLTSVYDTYGKYCVKHSANQMKRRNFKEGFVKVLRSKEINVEEVLVKPGVVFRGIGLKK